MALLKFFCLTAATIIVTVETFADFAIVLSHIAGIGSLVSVEGQSNGDVEWGYAGRRKGLSDHTLHLMSGAVASMKAALFSPILLRDMKRSTDRRIAFGCVVPAFLLPPASHSLLPMSKSTTLNPIVAERNREKQRRQRNSSSNRITPYTLVASAEITKLPSVYATVTFFSDAADQRQHHAHVFQDELCLWDSSASITHVLRSRVPPEIRRGAIDNLVDIQISFKDAASPVITTQALMVKKMPNDAEFFMLGQEARTYPLRVGVLTHAGAGPNQLYFASLYPKKLRGSVFYATGGHVWALTFNSIL